MLFSIRTNGANGFLGSRIRSSPGATLEIMQRISTYKAPAQIKLVTVHAGM